MDALAKSTSSMALVNTEDEWEDMDSSMNSVSLDEVTTRVVSEPKEEPRRTCISCAKLESSLPLPLKRCAKCHKGLYCSRECQKEDWKSHKKACATTDGPKIASNTTRNTGAPAFATTQSSNPFTALAGGKYLHSLSEKDAFTALIDSYRLRIDDEYTFTGEISTQSLYGGANPLPDFRRYLTLAEKRAGLLPPWWSKEKRTACEKLAVDKSQWSDLNCAVEKSDIMEHYGDGWMPMKLRMLAEKIYGEGISPF